MKKALVALAIVAFASTASAAIAGGSHDLTAAPYSSTRSPPASSATRRTT